MGKKINFDEKSKVKRFLSGKGFYVALAVCLVAVCGVAVGTFINSLPQLSSDSSNPASVVSVTPTTKEKPVDKPVTNIPDDRTTTTQAPTTTGKTTAVNVGPTPAELFVLPLSNEVLTEFSDGKQVYSKTMADWRTHTGVDIAASAGTEVRAAASGTVSDVSSDAMMGTTVTVDHGGGVTSVYANLASTPTVEVGDTVSTGDILGSVGNTAIAESALPDHLHFSLERDGTPVNPLDYLND